MPTFDETIYACGQQELTATSLSVFQVNMGRLCNLSCRHCHVGASPNRHEIMSEKTMAAIIDLAKACRPDIIDITGGAPEMNRHFRPFVTSLKEEGFAVKVRTNLTVLFETGQKDLPEFFRQHQVELVASLPCYLSDNVDAQRGSGVYGQSIKALKLLNEQGFGIDRNLPLNLVYNPGGPFLPPDQEVLQAAYRKELRQQHDLRFTQLLTITNMPIGRFLEDLRHQGKDKDYRQLLIDSFNPGTIDGLMCRHQVNIDWDGRLYDCDFNLALGMTVIDGTPDNVFAVNVEQLLNRRICTAEHCFGCTAGSGSSCGGALVA